MRIWAVLSAILLAGCASPTVSNPGPRTLETRSPSALRLGDIGLQLPGSDWFVADQRPFWARAFIVERSTDVVLIVSIDDGTVQDEIRSKRLGLEGRDDGSHATLAAVEGPDAAGISYFRLYDLDRDGQPFHCVFYAFRQLTDRPARVVKVTGMWFTTDDGRYTPQALSLLRSVEYLPDE